MKKIAKTTKAPAPATKPTSPVPAGKTTALPKILKLTPAPAAPPAIAAKPSPAKVTIIAKIDVGFGNALYVRGDGGGLSWDKGTPLGCQATDTWSIVLPAVARPFAFKLVLNDQEWSLGKDYLVAPGDTVTVTPGF